MKYQVFGPYDFPKKTAAKGKVLDLSPRTLKRFWDVVDVAISSTRTIPSQRTALWTP